MAVIDAGFADPGGQFCVQCEAAAGELLLRLAVTPVFGDRSRSRRSAMVRRPICTLALWARLLSRLGFRTKR